jgi:hypothetical protein
MFLNWWDLAKLDLPKGYRFNIAFRKAMEANYVSRRYGISIKAGCFHHFIGAMFTGYTHSFPKKSV